jgi:DNA mismatch repair protein MutL
MTAIKTLREDVYKKIAAGEVVERPLSVVMVLVENSIDSGADAIDIELAEGGKQLIKITDNGSGFAPDDIETAFKNHSTSKISELSDFNSLATLGFRGEALPSILEVSKMELRTSDNDDGRGILCILEDGRIIRREEIACKKGTTIAVKELFYNFPVRKKFLKTERTELNQVISFLEPVTLLHHDKSFSLIHNDKTVFIYKKVESLKERIYQVFGKDFLDSLQPVKFERDNYRLTGYISQLNTGLSVKKRQYFFVNRRPVKERTLIAAVNKTFEKFLEKHRFPASILIIDLPPREVDVNIHPMKLEIKFENSSAVYQFIKKAIENTFGVMDEFISGLPAGYGAVPVAGRGGGEPVRSYPAPGGSGPYNPRTPQSPQAQAQQASPGQQAARNDFEQAQLFAGGFIGEDDFLIIGQYKNSYILVEKNNDLLIVDQHNAQERVNFDQLKKEYQASSVTSITPLFPVIVELSPSEADKLDSSRMELLKKMGFRLEPLGGNTYDIKSFPQILGEKNIKDALRSVIHMDFKDGEIALEDGVLAEIACKSAIKVNHKLYPDQMKTIVKNLFETENPYFCPHKRPIIVEFTLEQIEKQLKRK